VGRGRAVSVAPFRYAAQSTRLCVCICEKGTIDPEADIFYNLVFGDYDVVPAEIEITMFDGSSRIVSLQAISPAEEDGLIQAATTSLDFNDVFRDDGGVWNGSLRVDFVAPNEPYTAFDFVELSTTAIPEPSGGVLVSVGVVAWTVFGGWRRRRWRNALALSLSIN
jgi:hypothetical protein